MQLHRVLGTRQGFNPISVIAQPLLEELYEKMPGNFTPTPIGDNVTVTKKDGKIIKESFLGGRRKNTV